MARSDEFPLNEHEPQIPDSDPIRKYILLVLWQAQTDLATELIIGKVESNGVPVRYKVEGRWYTLTPFPAKLRADVVRHLRAMAKMNVNMREGNLDELAGYVRMKWTVRMTTPDDELILTPEPTTP